MSAVVVLRATPDVLDLLRGVVEKGDEAALSQAEFNLFQVLDQARWHFTRMKRRRASLNCTGVAESAVRI